MHDTLRVTEVRFAPAPDHLVCSGLIGWSSFVLDGRLRVAGVAVRRTERGRPCLSYPVRDEGVGRRFEYFKPIDDATRRDIERQVLEQLGEVVS